jgi:hypothetical protein
VFAGVLAVIAVALAGCGHRSAGYKPTIKPADFSTTIDNPYFPIVPGTRWLYEGPSPDGVEHNEVFVTSDTKTIMGVVTRAVRDTVSVRGQVTEDTTDYYAQDTRGNVWYFGEDTATYENGKRHSTEGTWRAGVRGAQPGMVMEAHPRVGDHYREEYYLGHAEDRGSIVALNRSITIGARTYSGCLLTQEETRLDHTVERKYYARGIGVVLDEDVKGGHDRSELITVEHS